MSTRSVIARVEGDSWRGRYIHSDGYPTYRGMNLWALYHDEFQFDAARMLRELVDAHPVGWSHLGDELGGMKGAVCYCHGRGEKGDHWITPQTDTDTEWCYAINERTHKMFIYVRQWESGEWKYVETVDLRGEEPNWELIENRGYVYK